MGGTPLGLDYQWSFTTQTPSAVTGNVFPPTGIDPTSLSIISYDGKETTPDKAGNFTATVIPVGTNVVAAMVPGKSFGMLAFSVIQSQTSSSNPAIAAAARIALAEHTPLAEAPSIYATHYQITASPKAATSPDSLAVDFQTTAEALLFMTPYFHHSDPSRAAAIMAAIASDPNTAILARDLESASNESEPLSDAAVQTDLQNAVVSILNTLAVAVPQGSVRHSVPPSVPSQLPISTTPNCWLDPGHSEFIPNGLQCLDLDYFRVWSSATPDQNENYSLNLTNQSCDLGIGCAVDWLVLVAPISTGGKDVNSITAGVGSNGPDSPAGDLAPSCQIMNPSNLLDPTKCTALALVQGQSVFSKLDLVGDLTTYIGRALNLSGGTQASTSFTIPANLASNYVLRAYSGGGPADFTEMNNVLGGAYTSGSSLWFAALAENLAHSGLQYVETLNVLPTSIEQCALEGLTQSATLLDEITQLGAADFSTEASFGVAFQTGANTFLSDLATQAVTCTEDHPIAALLGIGKQLGSWFTGAGDVINLLSAASSAGEATQRLAELITKATPLETAIISVGQTTTTPSITGISPSPVQGLDGPQTVQISGTGFAEDATVNWELVSGGEGRTSIPISVNSNLITASTNFGNQTASWQVQIVNPDGTSSNWWPFKVTANTSALPDLVPQNVTISTTSVTAGGILTVSLTMANVGSVPAGASTTRLRLNQSATGTTPSDPILGDIGTPGIAARGSVPLSLSATIPSGVAAGTYYVWAVADNLSQVQQSKTSNDYAHSAALVVTAALPAPKLSFTDLNPSSFSTTTAPYAAVATATGSNFTNLAKIVFVWTGSTSGTATWSKGDANWTTKLVIHSDTSLTMSPPVVAAADPAGTTNWTVTLTDNSQATASRTFTVTYAPTTKLSFTNLNPSSFSTTTAPYTAVMTGTGSNFTNLTKIVFVWTGSTTGTATWSKGDANWTTKLVIHSDTSLTMSPAVVAAADPAGTTNWTVTLTDSSQATASRTFAVTYTPPTKLSFTNLNPSSFSTATAPYTAVATATGSNFTNLTKIVFVWTGSTSGTATWNKGDSNWNTKLTINSDTSLTMSPAVVAAADPAGTTNWTVTLTDSSQATASRTFAVTYAPPTKLSFTSVNPSSFNTTTAPYTAVTAATGSNFTNLTKIVFVWTGSTSGTATWNKGDSNWNTKLTINSDTSLTMSPEVVAAADPAGTTNWTVTLTDSSQATASRTFTVTYAPPPKLSFTNLNPSSFSTSTAPYTAVMTATGSNFTNLAKIVFVWTGSTSGTATWNKGDANWTTKLVINSDTALTMGPEVAAVTDPAGTTNWTVTLTDSSQATASRTFAVTYAPPTKLSFSNLNPSSFSTTTAPYTAVATATGSNFTNLTKIAFVWTGSTSGTATWNKGDSNWNTKLTINSDTSLTINPEVVAALDPAGTTNWTVTLTDSSQATASRTFAVTYTPPTKLSFTNLNPSSFSTGTAPYTAVATGIGSNFTNLTKIAFVWTGSTSGTATWNKGDSNWNTKLVINSDTSLTISPEVVAAGDPAGTTSWTVTLTDSSQATASRTFAVTYTP